MRVLENVEPKRVMYYFEEISNIPHGSRNTKQISDYLVGFAKERGLTYRQDELGNVVIWKDGSAGSEDKAPIIIQGHIDMVCEKAPDCTKNMETEGLDLEIDGDSIKAKGTTLGGDDGVAVAMALAILDGDSNVHPPIEAIFTVDEEIGMLGAADFDASDIKGKMMLNIDSEEEGIFTVSCAGGVVAECVLPLQYEAITGKTYYISVSGLTGGHSGIEIIKNRANASVCLGRILYDISREMQINLVDICGGAKDNAIPVSASAKILVSGDDSRIADIVVAKAAELKNEFALTDANISISCKSEGESTQKVISKADTDKIIYMVTCLPNGIQRMSPADPNFVQTSLNLGILKIVEGKLSASYCVRSSVLSEKKALTDRLDQSMSMIGGHVEYEGDYPGWEYKNESPLRDLMVDVYTKQYNSAPKVEAVHAGVECGFFASKIDGLDCVSFGPNLKEIHTYRESMSITSVHRVYQMVLTILERLA